MVIADLGDHRSWLPVLARWHYDQWGPLTGASSFEDYVALLTDAAARREVPSVLIAVADGALLGSANLVASDLPPRPRVDTMARSTLRRANATAQLRRRSSRARRPRAGPAMRLRTCLSLHIRNPSGVLLPARMARCRTPGVSPAGENDHGL